uniref:Integrase catalytic domain-containing protein n=1 Tax=Cyprinus carpio TaxID=7962 RepID=A0A8C1PVR7_CYPCA
MDIVGPLEKTKTGNRYMLVITDYATRYPEVFPLKSIKARVVASALIQLFSRVGFPKSIVTDQGSNFMSELLKQVYKLFGIKGVRTTPYHPQTDGLTERFNQTLKQMLRKFVVDKSDDWDQWLPYLLFAYREVPQASTGFSPFELLYGREVRGPLVLLKDLWNGGQDCVSPTLIVDYVVQMREKLEAMGTLAQEHMAEAQKLQKTWYDQKANTRNFEPGTQVLVMLPTDASKLSAKWQGPFEVLRKLGPVTYEVATPGQKRSKWTLHVNLLKEWFSRSRDAGAFMIRKLEDEEEVEAQYLPISAPSCLSLSHLPQSQQLEIQRLCDPQVFQRRPGHTNLVEHDIVLREGACPKHMSHRIPERLLEALRVELDEMLAMKIVEPSKSEWCSPVVLVPKK